MGEVNFTYLARDGGKGNWWNRDGAITDETREGMQEGKDTSREVFTSREVASNFSAVVASVIMRHYTILKKKKKKKKKKNKE